jgi:hypothetical protein
MVVFASKRNVEGMESKTELERLEITRKVGDRKEDGDRDRDRGR